MVSMDLKDGNNELEAGLLSNYSDDDDSPKRDVYDAPPPKQISPAKRRKTLACYAMLAFLVLYIVGFMATSTSGLRFTSCAHGDLTEAQDDELASLDVSPTTSEDLAQDLSPASSSDDVLVPPTLIVLERRQEDGNSTTSPTSAPAEPSTSSSSNPPPQTSTTTSEEDSTSVAPSTSRTSRPPPTSAVPSSSSSEGPASSESTSENPASTSSTVDSESTSGASSSEEPSPTRESSSSEQVFTTSSEVRHTYTTTLPGGEATVITATTWVGVAASPQITDPSSEPDLQGSSSHLYYRLDFALLLAAGVGFFVVA